MFRKNQMTGETMYPLRAAELYQHEELFYLESEGNGNIRKIQFTWPTAEEQAATERERKINEMSRALPELLVDRGLTLEKLLASLGTATPALAVDDSVPESLEPVPEPAMAVSLEPEPEPVAEEKPEFPQMYAPGRWLLSDGRKMQGTRVDAKAAEARL